ncbi:Cuticle protein 1 [Papilio machaon]|uniref:Cuticle protein 1 n=1 Tax=Papilio machaon TaxID=76193 RepID=A0A194QZQ7_PAPMA|nr:Cuticle protein 1 [Papilio machaon]
MIAVCSSTVTVIYNGKRRKYGKNDLWITFAAILGFASAGLIAPLVYTGNAGDAQAAAINANVAANDYARNIVEKQSLVEENVLRNNNAAIRNAIDTGRDLHERAYWGGVVATQNYIAAAQSQAAGLDGAAAGARAAYQSAQLSSIAPIAPIAQLAYAGYGAHGIAPYGLRAW